MKKTAVFWIRDGVFVDRMHVNPVAFAVAALSHAEPKAITGTNLTELTNFAFATSGISCLDKIRRFNEERMQIVSEVSAASHYYNKLASEAASQCHYFDGACGLVKELGKAGVLNFITSAVEQSVLDAWALSPQGVQLVPHLTEVLGQRPGFNKGRDHFSYVREHYGVEEIFYIADAVAEISNGAQLSQELKIYPVGFAHVITPAKVRLAHKLVLDAHARLSPVNSSTGANALAFNEAELSLPDAVTLCNMLKSAKATHVVVGDASDIIGNLSAYLQECGVLQKSKHFTSSTESPAH